MGERMSEIKVTEEDGVKAIIYLQKLAGKDEPEDKARRGWRGMQDWEKQQTIYFYNLFNQGATS